MKISVITPTKNAEKYIWETLQSIHGQNYPDLEHIIVDGNSTDNTVDLVNKFRDQNMVENIQVIVKEDRNMYEAINRGLRNISGDVFACLNADDCYTHNAFHAVAGCFAGNEDVDMVFGNCEYVDERGKTIFWSNNPSFKFERLVRTGTISMHQPETFYRRRVLDKVGYFDVTYNFASDYDYLLRIGKTCSVMRVREVLVTFRLHNKSLAQKNWPLITKEAKEIVKKYSLNEPVIINKMLTMLDLIYVKLLLIRPRNVPYISKKIRGFFRRA